MTKIDSKSNFDQHEEFKSPFENLIHYEQESSMQYFGNGIYDTVFKFGKVSESDVKELETLLDHYCNDKLFNKFIAKLFSRDTNAYNFKTTIQNTSEFPNISVQSAQSILSDVFKATENQFIKLYCLFLTISIETLFDEFEQKFTKLGIYNGAFYHFFIENLTKFVEKSLSAPPTDPKLNPIKIHDKFCLLSFVCQADGSDSSLPGKLKYFNIALDYSKCNKFNDVWKQLVQNYDVLFPNNTQGFDLDGSFENSVRIFTYIAPSWDKLAATFTLRRKQIPLSFSQSGGNRFNIPDSDIVKVFAGDYSLVPENQSSSGSVNIDVISNYNAFRQLSNSRKLQVSNFILSNRERFNNILGEATKIIINGLKVKLDERNVKEAFARNQFTPTRAKDVGFGGKDIMKDESMSFVNKLKESFDNTNFKTFNDGIDFIVHKYIPLLHQFENRCYNLYGEAEARGVLAKYATSNVLNVMGVSSKVDTSGFNMIGGDGMSGGRKQKPQVIEKRVEVPVIKEVEVIKEIPVGKDYVDIDAATLNNSGIIPTGDEDDEMDAGVNNVRNEVSGANEGVSKIFGGTSSEDLINALIDGQKKFNREYEDVYRKLISALNAVNISDVHAQTFAKLYGVCNQFESIAIKSSKTTSFISGYYGAKNYNRLYTLCVENTIKAITEANVPAFNGVVDVLTELKELMTRTAREVQELRIKFISAPKNISEMLIVASRDVKQPCSLTRKDFNSLSDAIARIYNTIRTYTTETNVYNTKQQLENYLTKIEERTRTINEHYDQQIYAFKVMISSLLSMNSGTVNKEVDYGKEAFISITNQKRDCMIYLNKILDSKLTQERIESLKDINLNQQQIENIEKAFLAFKNVRITESFKKDMEKLAKDMNPASVGSMYKLIKRLRKLILKSQYINFISQLYRELNIFSSDFDWPKFTETITNLIVLSSIRIQAQYKFTDNNERITHEGLMHNMALEFEKYFNDVYGGEHIRGDDVDRAGNYPSQLTNSAYNFMLELVKINTSDINDFKGMTQQQVKNSIGLIYSDDYKDNFEKMNMANDYTQLRYFFNRFDANHDTTTCPEDMQSFFMKKNNNGQYDESLKLFKDHMSINNGKLVVDKQNADILANLLPNTIINGGGDRMSDALRIILLTYMTYLQAYREALTTDGNDADTESKKMNLPYYVKHLPIYLAVLYKGLNTDGTTFKTYVNRAIEKIPYYSVSVSSGSDELSIAKYAIDSLFANVVAVVDKYWSVKYNGIMPLPLNINMVLRGGNKQEGGTIFDSMPLHDQTFSSVIPEAVPFYICAFHICQYYINTFDSKRGGDNNDNDTKLILNINKISVLYPIYEIFGKYQATIDTLTPTQMKTALAVFNEIWNQTQGNEAARLSRSIDLIFNELNACFIFTDKLQLEIIKSTNSLSKTAVDVINNKIDTLVSKMKETLNDSVVEFNEDPETQAKRFESILNKAYNKVKNEPELQRLAKLKTLLTDQDKDGNLKDFYKFMELVVSPMLVSARSYIHIFSLFDNYTFQSDLNGADETKIEFSKYEIYYKDPTDDVSKVKECMATAWEIIEKIRRGERMELKALLIENPIVLQYNKLKLKEALDDYHQNGRFVMPNFWIVMDEHTYPTQQVVSFKIKQNYTKNDNIALMRQLWPTVKARTVADYYNHCVSEFVSDYDHFVHNFLSYPGLSDRTIKVIAKASHDAIKIGNNKRGEGLGDSKDNKFGDSKVYTLKDAEAGLLANAKNLTNIPVNKTRNYIYPPPYPNKVIIPRFNGDMTPVEELITTESSKTNNRKNVQVDGTGIYIISKSAATDSITGCEYTWIDWVVFNIAKCDKTNFCLPYKLLQVLQDYPGLSNYLRTPGFEKKGSQQKYNRLTDGTYANIITQNILARSMSPSNKDKIEYATLNNSWVASLVATTPYLINTLVAHKNSMDQSVTYNRNSVIQVISNLIDGLTLFYDEIGNYAPFMPFMTDSVQLSTSRVRPHAFGELLSFINNNNLCNLDASDFIKLEWANMWFFNGIDNLTFPDYKNKDRFEWIKQFAGDVVNNGTFKSEFDTTIQTLGRNVWSGLIAKTAKYSMEFKNVYREIDEIIIKVINIMCECDIDIIQKYVNNVIDEYKNNMITGTIEAEGVGEHREERADGLAGGNKHNKTTSYSIPPGLKDFANRLTRGLVDNNEVVNRENAVDYGRVDEPAERPSANRLYLWADKAPKALIEFLREVGLQGTVDINKFRFTSFRDVLAGNTARLIADTLNKVRYDYMKDIKKNLFESKIPEICKSSINAEYNTFTNELKSFESEYKNGIKNLLNKFDLGISDNSIAYTFAKTPSACINRNPVALLLNEMLDNDDLFNYGINIIKIINGLYKSENYGYECLSNLVQSTNSQLNQGNNHLDAIYITNNLTLVNYIDNRQDLQLKNFQLGDFNRTTKLIRTFGQLYLISGASLKQFTYSSAFNSLIELENENTIKSVLNVLKIKNVRKAIFDKRYTRYGDKFFDVNEMCILHNNQIVSFNDLIEDENNRINDEEFGPSLFMLSKLFESVFDYEDIISAINAMPNDIRNSLIDVLKKDVIKNNYDNLINILCNNNMYNPYELVNYSLNTRISGVNTSFVEVLNNNAVNVSINAYFNIASFINLLNIAKFDINLLCLYNDNQTSVKNILWAMGHHNIRNAMFSEEGIDLTKTINLNLFPEFIGYEDNEDNENNNGKISISQLLEIGDDMDVECIKHLYNLYNLDACELIDRIANSRFILPNVGTGRCNFITNMSKLISSNNRMPENIQFVSKAELEICYYQLLLYGLLYNYRKYSEKCYSFIENYYPIKNSNIQQYMSWSSDLIEQSRKSIMNLCDEDLIYFDEDRFKVITSGFYTNRDFYSTGLRINMDMRIVYNTRVIGIMKAIMKSITCGIFNYNCCDGLLFKSLYYIDGLDNMDTLGYMPNITMQICDGKTMTSLVFYLSILKNLITLKYSRSNNRHDREIMLCANKNLNSCIDMIKWNRNNQIDCGESLRNIIRQNKKYNGVYESLCGNDDVRKTIMSEGIKFNTEEDEYEGIKKIDLLSLAILAEPNFTISNIEFVKSTKALASNSQLNIDNYQTYAQLSQSVRNPLRILIDLFGKYKESTFDIIDYLLVNDDFRNKIINASDDDELINLLKEMKMANINPKQYLVAKHLQTLGAIIDYDKSIIELMGRSIPATSDTKMLMDVLSWLYDNRMGIIENYNDNGGNIDHNFDHDGKRYNIPINSNVYKLLTNFEDRSEFVPLSIILNNYRNTKLNTICEYLLYANRNINDVENIQVNNNNDAAKNLIMALAKYYDSPDCLTAKFNLIQSYLSIADYESINHNESTRVASVSHHNALSLKGGVYSVDKTESILAIAAGIAKSIKNRAIYVDPTQINTFPIMMYKDGTMPNDLNQYLYKYLYNPNLCSLFNKTTYSNTEFAIANAANQQLFILDPETNLNVRDIIDLTRNELPLSQTYVNIMNKLNGNPNDREIQGGTCGIENLEDHALNGEDYVGSPTIENFKGIQVDKLKYFINYQRRFAYGNYHDYFVLDRYEENGDPDNLRGVLRAYNINNKIIEDLEPPMQYKNPVYDDEEGEANPNRQAFNPDVINVSYENAKTTITPKTHVVKLDDKMFLLIPFSPAFSQHLFSPQKDIYNATLISTTQLASPTIIQQAGTYLDFSQHIQNLNALNEYDLYIGDEPTYDKDITNYKEFTTNPIYTFIELLLQKNLNEIFDPKEAIKFNNFGFDIGSVKSLTGHGLFGGTLGTSPHHLSGGYNIGDSISPRFVNSLPVISSTNEMELLSSLYNMDGTDTTAHTTSDGKQLYSYIFKSDFGGGRVDPSKSPSKVMFSLILNYFHKYNISFNSMFNQLCYPSILFNASALRLSIDRLNALVKRFGASHDAIDEKTYKGRVIQLVEQYIGNYVKGDDSALDKCSDYRFQIKFKDRKLDVSFTDIIKHLKRNRNGPDFKKYNVLWLSNQYSCPSIANNFFTEYVKYITIDPKANKELLPIQQLFPTGISSALRHLDSISTFTSVLFMLLKQTSYYDHEYDRDTTFFNVTNPEPFSVI